MKEHYVVRYQIPAAFASLLSLAASQFLTLVYIYSSMTEQFFYTVDNILVTVFFFSSALLAVSTLLKR